MKVKGSELNDRKFVFSKRVVGQWNKLPEYVVMSTKVTNSKKNYDIYHTPQYI